MKRVVYLFIVIAAIAAIIGVGYFFRYRAGVPEPTEPTGGLTLPKAGAPGGAIGGGELPPAEGLVAGQKFGVITQTAVRDFFVDAQNNVFYIQPDGQVIRILNGKPGALSSAIITNLGRAAFSFDGRKITVALGGHDNAQLTVFDVPTKTWQPLSGVIQNPVWSPNDHRIAYFAPSGNRSALTLLELGTPKAKPQSLLALHGEDLVLQWAESNTILVADRPSAFAPGSLWSFNTRSRTLTSLIEDEVGATSIWNKEGDQGVVFLGNRRTNLGGRLELVDKNGATLRQFALLTLPSKCAFYKGPAIGAAKSTSTKTTLVSFLLCAVPRRPQSLVGSPMPDAYLKKSVYTSDDFVKINLADGTVQEIFTDPAYTLDAENLRVFNKKLFFVNRYDERLYAISLE